MDAESAEECYLDRAFARAATISVRGVRALIAVGIESSWDRGERQALLYALRALITPVRVGRD